MRVKIGMVPVLDESEFGVDVDTAEDEILDGLAKHRNGAMDDVSAQYVATTTTTSALKRAHRVWHEHCSLGVTVHGI